MKRWALYPTEQAIRAAGSKKLIAFHNARTAGLNLPDDAVLLRGATAERSPLHWFASDSDRAILGALAEAGHGKLVLRDISGEIAHLQRAIVTPLSEVETAANRLLEGAARPRALYIQAYWPGLDTATGRIVTVITSNQGTYPPLRGAYQTSRSSAVSPFHPDDPCWMPVAESCQRLEAVLGICTQAVFGLSGSSPTLLSIRRAPLPLAAQINASASLAEHRSTSRGPAIAAIADALDAAGTQYHLPQDDRSARPLRGRSVGEGWATGRLAFSPVSQARIIAAGDPVILVRTILRAEDCDLFREAVGVVSLADGVSSHFALLAGSLRKPCLVDLTGARIHNDRVVVTSEDLTLKEGDWVTMDERENALLAGRASPMGDQATLPSAILTWAHDLRADKLLVNCEDSADGAAALASGADGIGLCRSERHLVASPIGLAALRRVVTSTDEGLRADATQILCQVLGSALETLLAAVPGKQVAYRLLEPAEVMLGFGPNNEDAADSPEPHASTTSHAALRGEAFRTRYAFLYEAQIETAIQAAETVARRIQPVPELLIVVPMVSDVAEYEHWHAFIRTAVRQSARDAASPATIGVGVMIETPRAALLAGDFARHCDAFLVGTNDLTALVWGLDRFTASRAAGHTIDPFARFDAAGVGRLLTQAICEARAVNPNLRVTICGSHASVRHDADMLLDTGAHGLSCQIDAIPRIALQLARRSERLNGRLHAGLPAKSVAALRSAHTLAEAMKPFATAAVQPAGLANLTEWAEDIARGLSLPWTGVWKFFKRDLVAHWFGPREARRFMPGWQIEPALQYALSLSPEFDTRIRYSVFPADIACRAFSDVFPGAPTRDAWRAVLERLDPGVAIEIFPQQPVNRTAFRAVLRDMSLSVEGAPGQAIDIFWKAPQQLSKFTYDGCTDQLQHSSGGHAFDELFTSYLPALFAKSQSLRDHLGAEWISLEGYAGPAIDSPIFIADLDLPLDGVLIGGAPAAGN